MGRLPVKSRLGLVGGDAESGMIAVLGVGASCPGQSGRLVSAILLVCRIWLKKHCVKSNQGETVHLPSK